MNTNVGPTDRLIRLVLALVCLVVAFVVGLGSALSFVLLVVAAVLAVTAFVRFCPLYKVFGMNTCPVDASGGPRH